MMEFEKIIKNPVVYGNPFSCHKKDNAVGSSTDNIDSYLGISKFIRCPICLGHVIGGKRPNNCFHVYCYYCLQKWGTVKKVCPTCRRPYSKLITVNLNENWIKDQLEEFAVYVD